MAMSSDSRPSSSYQRPSARFEIPETNIRMVDVEWDGGMQFTGGPLNGQKVTIDANGVGGPGPMQGLLVTMVACSGADILSILEKMQVRVTKFRTHVEGVRAADHPRRYIEVHFTFELAGEGLDETKARRAIDLSLTKYCSVILSLREDIKIQYDLVLGA
jgi:putative redox protein